MRLASSLLRTLGFAAAYVAAAYAGRLTVLDQMNLSLVWPAAGVAAVWALVQYRSRWWAVDAAALTAVTIVINVATGASMALAAWFVAGNLVQAWVFAWLFHRWLPRLWGGGGVQPMARLNHLWRFTGAAFVATACGAMLGPTGLWLVSGVYSWSATAVWLTRNTVSILLVGVVGLRIGAALRTYRAAPRAGWRVRWAAVPLRRRLEYLALVTLSAVVCIAVFGLDHRLPLAFTVIVPSIWAGVRLHTTFVVLHDLVFATAAILLTLRGHGPFAQIGSLPTRVMVAQAFVGMIALVGLALALGRDERSALVARLRSAERSAARQARLMRTIVDSMTEGLTVVDEQGRSLVRNPAVCRLVIASGRMAGPDFSALLHLDGRPVGPDEMPYRRALAGTDVRDMDFLIRSPGRLQDRIVSVSSTALPDEGDGTRYAVTVFRDVTAERRHRHELASFAGVVAHDLQNPLATVEGWSEMLAESIEEEPAAARLADPVRRIRRAAARMRDMINDLLTYTMARDATVSPELIDLGALVKDIATARIDQAQSGGTPVPAFHIGELQPVYADPVLVRQLLENLIGNAIKYTAPGTVPSVAVGSGSDGRMVTVTVDDNGIGIPEGQQELIFDEFHRAHSADGYTGTGLGLGICKRIVERHGGTIRAGANPAGPGSRMTLTLPADAAAFPAPEPAAGVAAHPLPPQADREAVAGDPLVIGSAAAFEHAAHLVLEFLHEQMPLAFWAITRVENGRQSYLYLDAGNGYRLRQGASHPWADSFCVRMAAGDAPAVALDARQVPLYAQAGVNQIIDIGTYAGAVITEPDGSVFGTICGLDPQTRAGDPRMADAEPLLTLLGRLLTTVLAADRAQDDFTNALLREQLGTETDPLTGLPNRHAWQRLVEQARARYERLADPTVIAMLDVDLKAGGEACLTVAAAVMRRVLRDSDVIARVDGSKFAALLHGCSERDAPIVVARLRVELEAAGIPATVGWAPVTLTDGFAAAVEQADTAVYAAKLQRHEGQPSPVASQERGTSV